MARAARCGGRVGSRWHHVAQADHVEVDPERPWFVAQATRRAEMEMVTSYAGPYAEARFTRRPAFECFLAGGMGDVNAVRETAAAWFEGEDEQQSARARADAIARALVRSPKGWAAIQAVAAALLDLGRLDGEDVGELCGLAYGGSLEYDRWDAAWPPTPAQIRSGFLPLRERAAA